MQLTVRELLMFLNKNIQSGNIDPDKPLKVELHSGSISERESPIEIYSQDIAIGYEDYGERHSTEPLHKTATLLIGGVDLIR